MDHVAEATRDSYFIDCRMQIMAKKVRRSGGASPKSARRARHRARRRARALGQPPP